MNFIGERMAGKKVAYIVGIIIVLAVIYVVAASLQKPGGAVSSGTAVLQLTDPPIVPNNTQALLVTYSSVQLHESGMPNSTGFTTLNASGTVNLMNLTNFTQTIATTSIHANQSFDIAKFAISNAVIVINGTSYTVTVPSSSLVVKFNKKLNSTNSVGIIDMTPTVVQIYTANTTLFVLVPSLKAVVVGAGSVSSSEARVGARAHIGVQESADLLGTGAQISITSASLSGSGNSTSLSVTVSNNGNSSVVLKHLMLRGYLRAMMNGSVDSSMEPTGISGVGAYSMFNASIGSMLGNLGAGSQFNSSMGDIAEMLGINSTDAYKLIKAHLNASTSANMSALLSSLNISANSTLVRDFVEYMSNNANASVMVGMHNFNISNPGLREAILQADLYQRSYHNTLNFIISQNGTLNLPFTEAEAEGPNGYVLASGSNVDLKYSGPASFGESHVTAAIIANLTYNVAVSGEDGAFATTNVTAS